MRKLLVWIIAATSFAAGPASADIWGASVIVEDSSGAIIAPSSPLLSVQLVSTPSTTTVLPPKIKLYLSNTAANPPAVITITSANYARIVDFHRALQDAIQSGGIVLEVRTKPPYSPMAYQVSLDSNIVSLTQVGY